MLDIIFCYDYNLQSYLIKFVGTHYLFITIVEWQKQVPTAWVTLLDAH